MRLPASDTLAVLGVAGMVGALVAEAMPNGSLCGLRPALNSVIG
jgi:hypothetical protein